MCVVAEVENFPFSKKKLCSLSRMEPQRECDAPVTYGVIRWSQDGYAVCWSKCDCRFVCTCAVWVRCGVRHSRRLRSHPVISRWTQFVGPSVVVGLFVHVECEWAVRVRVGCACVHVWTYTFFLKIRAGALPCHVRLWHFPLLVRTDTKVVPDTEAVPDERLKNKE